MRVSAHEQFTDGTGRNFLTPQQLSARYQGHVSVKTLAHWRCAGTGPPFTKPGGRIVYATADVLRWELELRRRRATRGAIGLVAE